MSVIRGIFRFVLVMGASIFAPMIIFSLVNLSGVIEMMDEGRIPSFITYPIIGGLSLFLPSIILRIVFKSITWIKKGFQKNLAESLR